jgi:hypothetical protein
MKLAILITAAFSLLSSSLALPASQPLDTAKATRPAESSDYEYSKNHPFRPSICDLKNTEILGRLPQNQTTRCTMSSRAAATKVSRLNQIEVTLRMSKEDISSPSPRITDLGVKRSFIGVEEEV